MTKKTRRKTESVVIFYEAIKLLQRRRVNEKYSVTKLRLRLRIFTEMLRFLRELFLHQTIISCPLWCKVEFFDIASTTWWFSPCVTGILSFCTLHYTVRVGSNRIVRGTNFKIWGSGHWNECFKLSFFFWDGVLFLRRCLKIPAGKIILKSRSFFLMVLFLKYFLCLLNKSFILFPRLYL